MCIKICLPKVKTNKQKNPPNFWQLLSPYRYLLSTMPLATTSAFEAKLTAQKAVVHLRQNYLLCSNSVTPWTEKQVRHKTHYILTSSVACNYWWMVLLKLRRNEYIKEKKNYDFLLKYKGEDESPEQGQRIALRKGPLGTKISFFFNFKGISLIYFETLLPN